MSKGGRFERKTPRRGRMIVLIVACAIAASVLGVVAFASSYVNGMLDEVNHVEVSKVEYTEAAEEVIIMQAEEVEAPTAVTTAATEAKEVSNSEDFVNYLIVCKPAWESNEGWLTDTMVLCTLNTRTKTLTMTSLLEDAYVQTPEYKRHASEQMKLNAIYGLGSTYGNGKAGSMEYMNQTLYDNFGIEIDHNIELDFELFARVVKRLGGVKIDLSEEEAKYLSEKTKTDVQPGEQQMDGDLALAYVQMWSAEEESGVTSISGQRKMVEAILKDIRTEYFADLEKIVKEMLPLITTSMTRDEMKECLLTMLPMLRDLSIEKGGTCPANYQSEVIVTEKGEEMNVLTFDVAETTKVMRALTKGEKE